MMRIHSSSMNTDLSIGSNCSIHTCSSQASTNKVNLFHPLRNFMPLENLPRLLASYIENCTIINTKWLPILFFICMSIKMKLLFEHAICFVSLAATRYITSRRFIFHKSVDRDETVMELKQYADFPLSITSSYESKPCSISSCVDELVPSSDIVAGNTIISSHSNSNLEPSRPICPGETKSSNNSPTRTESLSSLESPERSSPIKTSLHFLGVCNFEEEVDEWGHFTDISDDQHKVPEFDPFRSITKTMLRKRGHRLSTSLQKLSQLQEDILEEEAEEEME